MISIGKDPKKKKLKKKTNFSKKIVLLCIFVIIVYTAFQSYLSYKLGIELSPTLTTCVYAFFGTELAACALIKIFAKDLDPKEEESSEDTKKEEKSE